MDTEITNSFHNAVAFYYIKLFSFPLHLLLPYEALPYVSGGKKKKKKKSEGDPLVNSNKAEDNWGRFFFSLSITYPFILFVD